jgi:hypothetical protein
MSDSSLPLRTTGRCRPTRDHGVWRRSGSSSSRTRSISAGAALHCGRPRTKKPGYWDSSLRNGITVELGDVGMEPGLRCRSACSKTPDRPCPGIDVKVSELAGRAREECTRLATTDRDGVMSLDTARRRWPIRGPARSSPARQGEFDLPPAARPSCTRSSSPGHPRRRPSADRQRHERRPVADLDLELLMSAGFLPARTGKDRQLLLRHPQPPERSDRFAIACLANAGIWNFADAAARSRGTNDIRLHLWRRRRPASLTLTVSSIPGTGRAVERFSVDHLPRDLCKLRGVSGRCGRHWKEHPWRGVAHFEPTCPARSVSRLPFPARAPARTSSSSGRPCAKAMVPSERIELRADGAICRCRVVDNADQPHPWRVSKLGARQNTCPSKRTRPGSKLDS